MRSAISRFVPPLALMGVIFFLSDQPNLNSGLGRRIDRPLRKLAHMGEFGLLWWLWLRALGRDRRYLAAAIAVFYGVTDEYHQRFVEGRCGSPKHWGVDVLGVGCAMLADRMLRSR